MKTKVYPLQSFEHGGARKVGVGFWCSADVAAQLERAGLVTTKVEEPAKKDEATEQKQSSSLAAQASQKQTATKSKRGARSKKTES